MRSLGWALIHYNWFSCKKRRRAQYDDRDTDWRDAAGSQGMPRIAGHNQKLGRGQGGFYPAFQREHGSVDTLILDF